MITTDQDRPDYDEQGFTKPMPHPNDPTALIVYHRDDRMGHWVKLDPTNEEWVIASGEREGTKQGGEKRDRQPKRAIDEKMGFAETLGGFGQAIAHGGTMGFADEAIGLASPEAAAEWEANRKQFRQQHRIASGFGELIGGVGSFALGGGALRGGAVLAKGGGALGRAAVARNAAARAPRGLLNQTLRTGAEGAATGAAYGAGEAEGSISNRIDGAKSGLMMGGIGGAAVPSAMGLVKGAAGSVGGMIGGRMGRLKQGIQDDRMLGGTSPASARAMAREEAAGGGDLLLGGGLLGAGKRALGRATSTLSGKGGVTLAPEAKAARAMIGNIDAAKPSNWKDLVDAWRKESPDLFANMEAEEVWLRKAADYMESQGTARPGQILGTIDPQTSADVGSAVRGVGGSAEVQTGLLPAVRRSLRDLSDQVADSVEDWASQRMRKLGGESAESATTSGRRLRSRQKERSDEASVLYGRLREMELDVGQKRDIRKAFLKEDPLNNEQTGREIKNTWKNMVEVENRRLADLGLPPVAVGKKGEILDLQKALDQGLVKSAGDVEMLVRVVKEVAEKYNPSNNMTGNAARSTYDNLRGMAGGLYRALNEATGDEVAGAMNAYRRQSDKVRSFISGSDLVKKAKDVTPHSFDDAIQDARDAAVRGMDGLDEAARKELGDEAQDALAEGYVTALSDKARVAGLDGSAGTAEQVFLDAQKFLKRLFGDDTDDLLEELALGLQERSRLLGIEGMKPSAAQIDDSAAAAAARLGTFVGAGQTQGAVRETAGAATRWAMGVPPQELATARLAQLPMREGLGRLATMSRYDNLRKLGQQRLGEDLAIGTGLLGARATSDTPVPPRLSYREETRGLLRNYNR